MLLHAIPVAPTLVPEPFVEWMELSVLADLAPFAFLTVSAFAPVAGRWRGWWVVYYGALLVCWIFVSVAAFRKAARAGRMRQRKLARLFRQHHEEEKPRLERAGASEPPRH